MVDGIAGVHTTSFGGTSPWVFLQKVVRSDMGYMVAWAGCPSVGGGGRENGEKAIRGWDSKRRGRGWAPCRKGKGRPGVISERKMIFLSSVRPLRIHPLVRNPHRLMANNIQTSSDTLKVLPHTQYHTQGSLSPSNVDPDPLAQFRIWFTEASAKVSEPEIMTVSTATASGIPSSRTVLFKQTDGIGFVFFTNYTSRKSKELLENPNAALVFYWKELHKQVRIVGKVEKLSKEENEEYFHTRPVGSQLGAWASKQSTTIGEGEIDQRLEKYRKRFNINEGDPSSAQVPLPDFWGGWRVVPK